MITRVEISGPTGQRLEGCQALLQDRGESRGEQEVPVCMGGAALIGCNHYSDCRDAYYQRTNNPHSVDFIVCEEANPEIVIGVTTVARAPLNPQGA